MAHFYRFGLLITSILLILVLVWFGLRTYGLSRNVLTYQTPLVKKLNAQENRKWRQFPAGEELDIKRSPEGVRVGYQFYSNIFYSEGSWKIGDNQKFSELSTALRKFHVSFFFLNIVDSNSKQIASLLKLMDNGNVWDRIIFTAHTDNTVTNLRKVAPKWTYANSTIFLLKFMIFASLRLESLLDIPSDVLFIKTVPNYFMKYQNAFMSEARRQKKLIFIGPVSGPLDKLESTHWLVETTE